MFTILLYYKYIYIDDPEAFAREQKALCVRLGLNGRIIVAKEGINGTVEGTPEATEAYISAMKGDPRFADIQYKKSFGTDGKAFPRLSVKARKEIVSAHLDEGDLVVGDVNPAETTGKRLSPEELAAWFAAGKDFTIVDMRNDYEHTVGHFKDSVLPPLKNFRDLPKAIPQLEPLKNKTVLTVCTGGVRCEKASGYLVKKGFQDVYQLDGGIVSYMEKYPGKDFNGSLYVFDRRVTMRFDEPNENNIISYCRRCNKKSERYVNCSDDLCHDHFICCESCIDELGGKAFCINCEKKSTSSRQMTGSAEAQH